MIQVVDNPLKHPGKCGFCGSPGRDDRKFLDTGFRFPRFGTLYICIYCLHDLVKHFDFGPVAELKQQVEGLIKENKEIREENEQFRSALGIVNRYNTLDPIVDPDKSVDSENDQPTDNDKSGSAKNDQRSSEQTSKRGSKNVQDSSGTDSDDDSEFILDGDFKL